jgi:hypothetical protein
VHEASGVGVVAGDGVAAAFAGPLVGVAGVDAIAPTTAGGREAMRRFTPTANTAHVNPAAQTTTAAGSGRLRRRNQAPISGGRFTARVAPPPYFFLSGPCFRGPTGGGWLGDGYEMLPGGTVNPALAVSPLMNGSVTFLPTREPPERQRGAPR